MLGVNDRYPEFAMAAFLFKIAIIALAVCNAAIHPLVATVRIRHAQDALSLTLRITALVAGSFIAFSPGG